MQNSIQTRADPGHAWAVPLSRWAYSPQGGATVHLELGMLQRDDDLGPCSPANYRDG